jgi:hypothetical protein
MARSDQTGLTVSPTLVIGLGGTGVRILRQLKARIRHTFDPVPGIIEFLALDTEPCSNPPGEERIFEREFAYLGGYNATSILTNLAAFPHIEDWWVDQRGIVDGTIHEGARQKRCVGRLSLYVRWGAFRRLLDPKARAIRELLRKEETQQRGAEVDRATGRVKVFIIGSVCGGTGSGILLDVAFYVRSVFGATVDIVGCFLLPSCFLPEIDSRPQQNRIQANAYAALREINHFVSGTPFDACFPHEPFRNAQGKKNTQTLTRPFDSVYLVDRSNGKEYLSGLPAIHGMVTQHIFLDMLTPLGKESGARRANVRDLADERVAVGPNGTRQVLAVAGLATASLVLPSDRLMIGSVSVYSADLLRRRVIGDEANPTSPVRTTQLVNRFNALDSQFKFEEVTGSSPQVAADPLITAFEKAMRGGQMSGVQVDIDLSQRAYERAMDEAMAQLRSAIEEDFLSGGLHAVDEGLRDLLARIKDRRRISSGRIRYSACRRAPRGRPLTGGLAGACSD